MKMISVYSHVLDPLGIDCANEKPSVIYDRLRNAYNQGAKGLLENTRVFAMNDDEVDYDIIYEIWRNKPLHDILVWVNRKIILTLGIADYRTIGVRMRIATGMLNKIVSEGKLSRKLAFDIHQNFVTTLNGEVSAISTEDLPF